MNFVEMASTSQRRENTLINNYLHRVYKKYFEVVEDQE